MIQFRSLASSSSGNCYFVTDGNTNILLEAGLPIKQIQRQLDFKLSSIHSVLLSHEHLDHSRAAADLAKAGVDIYASAGTIAARGLVGHRVKPVEPKKQFTVGTWTVMPFDVEHDAEQPLGYLLANQAGEKLVFITDSYYCRYTFTGLTHIAVECNYSLAILDDNIAAGRVHPAMRRRLMRSHFSLDNVLDFLRANDLSKVEEVHLLHLSDTNSDEEHFKRRVQEITGKPVYVAGK